MDEIISFCNENKELFLKCSNVHHLILLVEKALKGKFCCIKKGKEYYWWFYSTQEDMWCLDKEGEHLSRAIILGIGNYFSKISLECYDQLTHPETSKSLKPQCYKYYMQTGRMHDHCWFNKKSLQKIFSHLCKVLCNKYIPIHS